MPESLQKILAEAKTGRFSSINTLSEDGKWFVQRCTQLNLDLLGTRFIIMISYIISHQRVLCHIMALNVKGLVPGINKF